MIKAVIFGSALLYCSPVIGSGDDNDKLVSYRYYEGRSSHILNGKTNRALKAENENPKGLYAGMFFGISSQKFSYGKDPIGISQIGYGRGGDSVVKVPNGVNATVDPSSNASSFNLDAGFYLGYFPGFLTFNMNNNQTLAFGAMSKLGLSFKSGFGGWLGAGPEVAYRRNAWSINAGYLFSYLMMNWKLGSLKLEGADHILIQESYWTGNEPNWDGESPGWRRHDEKSQLQMVGSAFTQSPYLRFGYNWEGNNRGGIGLVLGYRIANNNTARYELVGQHKKTANEHISDLKGPEFSGLNNSYDLSGVYFQIELFTVPF